jgi:mannose-6-phosphate isomerase-like protein (cupin superfamily)
MNRNRFLKQCLAAGAFISIPFVSLAKIITGKRVDKGIKVDAGKDRFGKGISLLEGDKFFCKVSTSDTDGDLYIFESTRDKKGGPAFHFHYEQDEWWYIIEGEFLFKVGEQTFTAKAGDSVFGPRMVPHAFAKTSEGIAKMLIGFQPAGKMEECFKKISEGVTKSMSDEERKKFRKEHGFEAVGPALTYEKK